MNGGDVITYRLADDVRYRRVLDEAVVVRQETNEVIIINEVSAAILDFFDQQGKATVDSLIDHLAEEYEVDIEVLKKDTSNHIADLLAAGIISSEE